MNVAPYNPKFGQIIKTDAGGTADHGFVAHYILPAANAVAAGVATVKAATALAVGATTTLLVADVTQPPGPRVLSITNNANTAVGNVVITGTDASGAVLTETIVAPNPAATVEGTRAFATITSIVLPAQGAGGDTISIGTTDKFGLPYKLPHDTILKILNNNTATTVAASSFSATVLAANYLDPTAAINAAQIDVYLIV